MVLNAYRNANAAVRATAPPEYFKDIKNLSVRVDSSAAEQYVTEFGRLQRDIKFFREKHQELLNSKLQQLQTDSAAILNETFHKFILETELEAHEKINRAVAVLHRGTLEKTDA